MKKILFSFLAILLCFTITGCNNESTGEGSASGKAKKFSGTYSYNPPTNNYYVEAKDIKNNDVIITARIDKSFTSLEKDSDGSEYMYHVNEDKKQVYTMYEGKWYIDSYSTYSDYEDAEEEIEPFSAMEDYFMKYFKAFDYEISKLEEYYIGNEKVAGIDCWVFDSKGLNAVQMKFWINPANGTTLKYTNKESGSGYEVTKMDLNYKTWTDGLVPDSYEGIEGL